MSHASLLPHIIGIARTAGARILDIYGTDFDVEHKADQSPLTAADLAAHKAIVAGLDGLPGKWPVLSEESTATVPFAERAGWRRYWLVDPLDGTKEFVKRNGEFTVNIALIEDHQPVLGVVYVPVTDTTYYAAVGAGASRMVGSEAAHSMSVATSERKPIVVGSRSHRGDSLKAWLAALGEHEMVAMGSSLKVCCVADGTADVYPRLGPTSEWDTAAAHAVVTCAGGQVVDVYGAPLRYNTKEDMLNPHFFVIGNSHRDWLSYLA